MKNPPLVFGAVLLGGVLLGGGAFTLSNASTAQACQDAIYDARMTHMDSAATLSILSDSIGSQSLPTISRITAQLDNQRETVQANLERFNRNAQRCSY